MFIAFPSTYIIIDCKSDHLAAVPCFTSYKITGISLFIFIFLQPRECRGGGKHSKDQNHWPVLNGYYFWMVDSIKVHDRRGWMRPFSNFTNTIWLNTNLFLSMHTILCVLSKANVSGRVFLHEMRRNVCDSRTNPAHRLNYYASLYLENNADIK